MESMTGERTVMQEVLFYEFNLERDVPADHLLRPLIAELPEGKQRNRIGFIEPGTDIP